jgi:16S rRNA (uracil1498-N3)-methyltransferase
MSLPLFLVPLGALDGVRPGDAARLDGAEARHAVTVRRIRAGERVQLADGAGARVRGAVEVADAQEVRVRVEERVDEPAPAVGIVLVQALAKGGRDELAVEAATEVGVDAVTPWQAARSVSHWSGAKVDRGRQRWAAVAAAAAKQARRARVPAVRPLVRGQGLVADVAEAAARGDVTVVLHEAASAALTSVRLPAAGEVRVVVGPEGGLTDDEVAALVAAGGHAVRMGPHVLRTSTAGPVAGALLAERLGRWVDAPARG